MHNNTNNVQTRLQQQTDCTEVHGDKHTNNSTDQDQSELDLADFTSDEKLPENFPEEFPGVTRYAPVDPSPTLQFDSGDIVLVNSLGNLAPGALIDEMKAMYTIACHLAVDEEQEITRGKILRVLLDD